MSREVARVVVDVMLKAEILDPQGSAILGALPRLGFDEVTAVRQGKHFELEVAEPVDEARLRELADRLLANTVIEEFTVRVVRGAADALPSVEARGAADALPAAEARGAADALPAAEARK